MKCDHLLQPFAGNVKQMCRTWFISRCYSTKQQRGEKRWRTEVPEGLERLLSFTLGIKELDHFELVHWKEMKQINAQVIFKKETSWITLSKEWKCQQLTRGWYQHARCICSYFFGRTQERIRTAPSCINRHKMKLHWTRIRKKIRIERRKRHVWREI